MVLINRQERLKHELEIHPRKPSALLWMKFNCALVGFTRSTAVFVVGTTLDDWFEAEHELADENQPSGKNRTRAIARAENLIGSVITGRLQITL